MTYQQLLKQTQALSLEDQQRLMIFLYKKFGSTKRNKKKTTSKKQLSNPKTDQQEYYSYLEQLHQDRSDTINDDLFVIEQA